MLKKTDRKDKLKQSLKDASCKPIGDLGIDGDLVVKLPLCLYSDNRNALVRITC